METDNFLPSRNLHSPLSFWCFYLWEIIFDEFPFFWRADCCENLTLIIKSHSYSSLTNSTSSSMYKYRITPFNSTTGNQCIYDLEKTKTLILNRLNLNLYFILFHKQLVQSLLLPSTNGQVFSMPNMGHIQVYLLKLVTLPYP